MAVATIQLSQSTVSTTKGTTKITITTVGNNIDSAVFAIEVLPRTAYDLNPIYRFSHVCSPAELVEFPDEEPGDNCYFRTDSITMIFDTAIMAENVLRNVEADVNRLVQEYNQLNALTEAGTGGVVSDSLLYEPIRTYTAE